MSAVLVVCTGNVCRSPMAEGFLRAALERRFGGAAPAVSSAGTVGWEGSGAMQESVEAAAERGIDIADHVARRLDAEMTADADLIVCMAGEHRDAVGALDPPAAARAFTLKELTGLLESSGEGRTGSPDDLPGRVAVADGAAPTGRVARAVGRGHRRSARIAAVGVSGGRVGAGHVDRPARRGDLRAGGAGGRAGHPGGALTCVSRWAVTTRASD